MLTRVACLPPKPQTQKDIYDEERLCRFNEQEALTTMLGSLTEKVCNEMLATKGKCFHNRCDFGMHPRIRGLSGELQKFGRNDAGVRYFCRSLIDKPLGNLLSAPAGKRSLQTQPFSGGCWRIEVKGVWKYLCRAVNKQGKAVDPVLTAKSDKAAARGFFDKTICASSVPDKVKMDKSGRTKLRSTRSMPEAKRQSSFNKSNTSITLTSKTIAPSNESRDRSSASLHLRSQMCTGARHQVDAQNSQRSAYAGALQ